MAGWVGLKAPNFIPHGSGGWTFKVKEPADSASVGARFQFMDGVFSLRVEGGVRGLSGVSFQGH